MTLAIAVWEIYIKISFFKLYSNVMFWPSRLQTFSCTLVKLPCVYWCKLAPKEIHSGDVPIIGELVNPWTPVYLTLSVVWLTSGHSTRANSKARDPLSVDAFKDLSCIFSKIVQNTTFEYFFKKSVWAPISYIETARVTISLPKIQIYCFWIVTKEIVTLEGIRDKIYAVLPKTFWVILVISNVWSCLRQVLVK